MCFVTMFALLPPFRCFDNVVSRSKVTQIETVFFREFSRSETNFASDGLSRVSLVKYQMSKCEDRV